MSATGTETFGQRVRRIRVQQGIRQIDLAEKAGISWRHLSRIERDTGGATRESTIALLASALGVEPAELIGDDDEEPELAVDLDVALRSFLRRLIREEVRSVA